MDFMTAYAHCTICTNYAKSKEAVVKHVQYTIISLPVPECQGTSFVYLVISS